MRIGTLMTIAVLGMAGLPIGAQDSARGPTMAASSDSAQLGGAPASGVPLTAADVNAWLDGFLPYAIGSGAIAGAVVVVVKDGQVLTQRGYGYADVEARTPVDPARTMFRPGSVSKLLTWTAVMQQVEAGKLDLDADVNGYLDFEIPPYDGQPVTLRNIMTHTPGFDDVARNIIFNDTSRLMSLREYLVGTMPDRVYPPGVTPAYSNYATALAGYIVQRVSGQPFDDYVDAHILQPLGMTHSTFRQPLPREFQRWMSRGYHTASGDTVKYELVGPAPAGSLAASGEDMGRFMIAHLQNGALDGHRILADSTARTMHSTALTLLPPLNRMELGFFEMNRNGHRIIGHLGDTEAFHTTLSLFLDQGAGLYASFNSPGKGGAAGRIRTALLDDFADRYFPGGVAAGRVDSATAAQHARLLAGHWVPSRGSYAHFLGITELLGQVSAATDEEGRLTIPQLTGIGGAPRTWVEIAPFVWRDPDSGQRLAARVEDGVPTRVSVDLFAPFMVFTRPPWYKSAGWLMPLVYASLVVLIATVVLWPVRALVRRHYGATLPLEGRALRAYRLSRVGALAIVLALAAWAVVVGMISANPNNVTARMDPLIWSAELFGAVAFPGGAALILWNAWVVWRSSGRWRAKGWSVALGTAALTVVWVAVVFRLVSFGVQY